MDKLLSYPGKTDKGINTFIIDEEQNYLVKTASEFHPTIASYINAAKRIPNVTQTLLTALGASEWWGDNVNSDYFAEDQLAHEGPEYGYKTFELFAKVYKHHVNKNPLASYGDVILSVYNPVYHRVELIVGIKHQHAGDIISRIESGDYPTWSMGCKIPYDVCSICGNKAPNRKYYCTHLKYQLGRIDPTTGRKVYAINIRPKFFDISYVLIPADKTAMTLKKVASTFYSFPQELVDARGNIISSAEAAEKMAEYKDAAIAKLSEMEKEIPAAPPASQDLVENERARLIAKTVLETKEREKQLPAHVIDRMCEVGSLPQILSTMLSCMIMPKPQEFQRIILVNRGHKDIADKLDKANACFDPYSYSGPITPGLIEELGISHDNTSLGLADVLQPYFRERSYTAPLMLRRMSIMVKEGQENTPPTYFNPNEKGKEGTSYAKSLVFGAALYAALRAVSGKSSGLVIDLIKKHPLMAASLGMGAYIALSKGQTDITPYRGRFSTSENIMHDSPDIYDRIERMRERPYIKVGSIEDAAGRNSAMLRRLLIGVPAVQMASGALQRHKGMHPGEEEGLVSKTIREHPTLISGVLVADALLARHGKGSYLFTHPMHQAQSKWLSGDTLMKSAGIVEEGFYPEVKSASVQDYVSSSLIWPLAVGGGNLPGRIVGSLFDQAALDLGQKLVNRSKQRKQNGSVTPKV